MRTALRSPQGTPSSRWHLLRSVALVVSSGHLVDRHGRIENNADRVTTLAHGLDLPPKQPTQHHHTIIAGGEVLFGMQGDGTLRLHRLPVGREALVLLLG